MDEDFATIIVATSIRAARDIGDLALVIKHYCNEDSSEEVKEIKIAIGSIVYEIMENLVSKVSAPYPNLKQQIADRIDKYERAF